ncbi:glycosyl hydrolase family 79 C-terminal domain-containing protein [Nocardia vinacea]|uniref:Glycosyl hydrolase family 79 C-terminal domain-containing protein n=1 Tax=Nocardia vinacea TaxID=96468 RepID=A0ABZ1YTR2_9NOCA|nr:glycosyl hydrolase family 79 C-terminal domain-containing protein [Nocardia vinacea]
MATVTVEENSRFGLLPSDVIGLSYEARLLSDAISFNIHDGNLAELYRLLGTGNIRLGGNSVDRKTFWRSGDSSGAPPAWATAAVTPSDIDRLAEFVHKTGWRVELAVGLGHLDPSAIADEARYAAGALGNQLAVLECGNEPNDFVKDLRAANYGVAQYQSDFAACADAIGTTAPLAGPNTTGAYIPELKDIGGRLSMITQHAYTLNRCRGDAGSAEDLLSVAADQELEKIATTLAVADELGIPLRLDESNSANCSGLPGVSDTYAAALWAVDYVLLMASHGVSGVNFHGSLGPCDSVSYSPVCADSQVSLRHGQFTVRPLFYGILFAHMMGTGVFERTSVASGRNLTAYAVRRDDGRTRVMLISKDSPAGPGIELTLHRGNADGIAELLYLRAPALNSTQNVTLQGSSIGPGGAFRLGAADRVTGKAGTYTFHLPAGAAAMVVLP